jgi:septation ring formation regulator EzrA
LLPQGRLQIILDDDARVEIYWRRQMSESVIDLEDVENDILNYEVADEVAEAAAAILEGQAKNVTISFCSGLDTCPS